MIYFLTVALAVDVWMLWCNHKTHKQRIRLLGWAKRDNFSRQEFILKGFDQVSYHRHMFMLMTFRDPWPSYGPDVLELVLTCEDKSL